MDIFYTYIYYDPSRKNEPIYVGKGKGERAWTHLTRKHMHPFIQRLQLMKRNNIEPIIGFYSELDEELAHLVEQELISKFGRKNLGLGTLLNLTDGGDGVSGIKHVRTAEHCRKLSEAQKNKPKSERTRKNISKACKGRIPHNVGIPLSAELKENLRVKNLGKIVPADVRKKIGDTQRGKKHPTSVCYVCGRSIGIRAIKFYHNDNCKLLPV